MDNNQIRENEQMQLAEQRYQELIALYTVENKVKKVNHMLLGGMLGRLMNGGTTTWDEIAEWLYDALKED